MLCDRELLSEMLSQDYEILEAGDGETALRMLDENGKSIALVLLDIVMPGMDGFAVLKAMNDRSLLDEMPVIMISGESANDTIRYAYEMGVSDYVTRPFDEQILNKPGRLTKEEFETMKQHTVIGDEFPIAAQVVALADVYDALTSERVYKAAYSHEKAVEMILSNECGVFNPLLMQVLQRMAPQLPLIMHREGDTPVPAGGV